jgi:hypothetical protein
MDSPKFPAVGARRSRRGGGGSDGPGPLEEDDIPKLN